MTLGIIAEGSFAHPRMQISQVQLTLIEISCFTISMFAAADKRTSHRVATRRTNSQTDVAAKPVEAGTGAAFWGGGRTRMGPAPHCRQTRQSEARTNPQLRQVGVAN